jgi:D-alanine-D-alanine ligase
MSKKITVGILFGGKSAEHEVSLQSAKNVFDAIDKTKYEPLLIGINKNGRWLVPAPETHALVQAPRALQAPVPETHAPEAFAPKTQAPVSETQATEALASETHAPVQAASRALQAPVSETQSLCFILNADDPRQIALNESGVEVSLTPGSNGLIPNTGHRIDVVFPILHGPFGEDGTVQGLLKLAGLPFVGSSVLASAVGMDKDVMKRLLRGVGLPIGGFRALTMCEPVPAYDDLVGELGTPLFVKPANMGSSVGVSKVHNKAEYKAAVTEAFQYDTKLIIEEYIKGRELECAVLGNEEPIASLPGEVRSSHEFYSYDAKYLDENGAALDIPAQLPEDTTRAVQSLALQTFKTLCAQGLARVDFFLKSDGTLLINEINTMPGFTRISMYPKLWEVSGISYTELIDRLIGLAFSRFEKEKRLRISR